MEDEDQPHRRGAEVLTAEADEHGTPSDGGPRVAPKT